MKRKLTATNLIGPGAVPVDRAYVEIAPAFPFNDGSATNWDIPVRINLVNGAIPTADQPMLEDTYLGEPMTWNIRVVFEDARAKFIGGSRQVAYQLPEGTGDVDYTELVPVDVVQPPEFGPTYLQQTLEARDETVELVAEAAGAVTDAEAAASAAAATAAGIPTTNDPIVKALLDDPASQTAVKLNSTFVTVWKPATVYAIGNQVKSPNGDIVTSNTAHTSSAAFTTDAAKWTLSSSFGTPAQIESAVRQRSDLRPANARPNTVLDSISASLMSKLDMHYGAPVVWLGGDSTGTEPTEWFNLAWKAILPRWPDAAALAYYWDAGDVAYKTPIIEQGVAAGIFTDTFTRVAADIIGSTPDVGNPWGLGTASKFGADGTKLYRTAADDGSSGSAIISLSATGRKFTQTGVIRIGTTGETGSRQTRLMPLYRGGDNVRLHLSGQGNLAGRIYVDVAGVATARQIGSTVTNAIPATTAPADYPYSITVDLDTLVVTAVINGNTITGSLTAPEAASFATATQAGIVSTHATFGLQSINVNVGSPSVAGLKIYNASVASTILQEQRDHLAAMMPERPDIAFISGGHNYDETYTVATYLAAIDALVADIRTLYPETPIVVTSQNPRNSPAVRVTMHAERMAALRGYCAAKGFGYLPGFEAFVGLPAQTSDGIHPTKSDSVDIPSGSAIWAAVLLRWLEARSGRPLR